MHRCADGARIFAGLLLAAMADTGAAEPADPAVKGPKPGDCGLVQEFEQIPNVRDAFPVDVLAIDSSPRDLRDYAFPLPPGPHSFELIERIPQDKLAPDVQGSIDESIHKRNLTIDVKANTVYVVGAKLLREHRNDPDAYWAPVIFQESGKRCDLAP